jgi:hypothetical protein
MHAIGLLSQWLADHSVIQHRAPEGTAESGASSVELHALQGHGEHLPALTRTDSANVMTKWEIQGIDSNRLRESTSAVTHGLSFLLLTPPQST